MRARQLITETLRDDRIPPAAWTYHTMDELVPDRDPNAAGTRGEYDKLIAATRAYYVERDLFFDVAAFDAGLDDFFAFVEAE